MPMSKYYIKCGSLELIYSTNKTPKDTCRTVLWEANEYDTLDEYFYVDERGYRTYSSADSDTFVISSNEILKAEGWKINKPKK
jgi:hypothetical protein